MNLKIEDLEKEMKTKQQSSDVLSSTMYSVSSEKFVHQSMKEALIGNES